MTLKTACRLAIANALALTLLSPPAPAQAAQDAADVSARVFDTGNPSPTPLSGETLSKRTGWTELPEGRTGHLFRGNAVLCNGRLIAVLRATGRGVELYSCGLGEPTERAVLVPAGGAGARLTSVTVVENEPAAVTVDAAFKLPGGQTVTLRCQLAMGRAFVKTEARGGLTALSVEAPCRFVVLPDFFADDMVIDATRIPVPRGEIPSENFLLQMVAGGEAIVVSVSKSRDQDARIELAGQGASRVVRRSQISYGKEGPIWVAVLEGEGTWHQQPVAAEDAGRILPLAWKMPYPAAWRVDWSRQDRLTGSWEMLIQRSADQFDKPDLIGGSRRHGRLRRWTTVLGRFDYPCWVDLTGRGNLQALKGKPVRFQGPALVYPIGRVKQTPLDRLAVVDVVRQTLGVGPCEYILDVEGQGAAMKGRATCATRDLLGGIYERRQQKQKRPEIEQALDDVLTFVTHIRGRIEDYRTFGGELLVYLDGQKKARPELIEFIADMQRLTGRIEANVQKRRPQIQSVAYVADLTDKFRRTLLDYQGDDALKKCQAITQAIVIVGANQDELVGESRMAVKNLRQAAGLAMAIDPRTAEVAQEIRRRTQKVLRKPATYEAPRH